MPWVAIMRADTPSEFKAFPQYPKNGVAIYLEVSGKGFDPNLPRIKKTITPRQAIANADKFLQGAYGAEFRAPVFKVSLERYPGNDSELVWCWLVGYFDPDRLDDIGSKRIFFVALDFKGTPKMRIERTKDNEATRRQNKSQEDKRDDRRP